MRNINLWSSRWTVKTNWIFEGKRWRRFDPFYIWVLNLFFCQILQLIYFFSIISVLASCILRLLIVSNPIVIHVSHDCFQFHYIYNASISKKINNNYILTDYVILLTNQVNSYLKKKKIWINITIKISQFYQYINVGLLNPLKQIGVQYSTSYSYKRSFTVFYQLTRAIFVGCLCQDGVWRPSFWPLFVP